MAIAEIEKTLKKITDTQLVIVRLMETNERKWNKRFEALEGRTDNLERRIRNLVRVAEAHEQRLDSLHDDVRTMVASADRVIKMIEDFAKGRKRQDGHR
ncbi:MAG: hypothetical protein HY648_06945 [Acidobacteria bacterium]|nr:hypothetical protein [Acidobacteriota bacterium]